MPIVTKVIQLKDIQGNLLLPHAYSASKDNNGNDIPNTYATITTVNTKANDSEVVHNTGTETIAGAKTFSTTPIVGTLEQTSSSNAAASTSYVRTAISDEDALVVHLTGDETITDTKTFIGISSAISPINVTVQYDVNEHPESNEYCRIINVHDKDGNLVGNINSGFTTTGQYTMCIESHRMVDGTDKWASIRAYLNEDGTAYAQAPTPPSATDNSTKVATTAWVRNHRATTKATTTSSASVDAPAYVVQNYKSGTNWYRVWSDGWIEQGGIATISAETTVTLPKAFSNTNYTAVCNPCDQATNATSDNNYESHIKSRTTTGFNIKYWDSDSTGSRNGNVAWLAFGY